MTFKPVDRAAWKDFSALFESRGGPKSCWCMVWRATAEEARHIDGKSRRGFMQARVMAGTPVGILGYDGGQPVAWCSIAPKETYRNLTGKVRTEGSRVWSIACFFIKREYRSQGLVRELIEAAAAYAKVNGAKALEAYPVDPDSPSYRFMGRTRTFQEMGFTRVGEAGSRRHIMVKELTHA